MIVQARVQATSPLRVQVRAQDYLLLVGFKFNTVTTTIAVGLLASLSGLLGLRELLTTSRVCSRV